MTSDTGREGPGYEVCGLPYDENEGEKLPIGLCARAVGHRGPHGELAPTSAKPDILSEVEANVNANAGTVIDKLNLALVEAEEDDWTGVLILAYHRSGNLTFLKSDEMADYQSAGLARWATLLTDTHLLEDSHAHDREI